MAEINCEQEENLLSLKEFFQLSAYDDLNSYNPQLFDHNDLNAKGILNITKKNDSTRLKTVVEGDVSHNTSFEICEQNSSNDCSNKDQKINWLEVNSSDISTPFQSPESIQHENQNFQELAYNNQIKNFKEERAGSASLTQGNGKEKQKKCNKISKSKKIQKKENSIETEKLSKAKKNDYPVKNLLKIIGTTIISKIKSKSFRNKEILQEKTKMHLIDPNKFSEWVENKNYIKTLVNFESYRLLFTDSNQDANDKPFKLVLRELVLWFLENEIFDCFIFEKKLQVDVTLYLEKIPYVLNGLENPKYFCSWK